MRWRVFRPSPAPLTDIALLAQALDAVAPNDLAQAGYLLGPAGRNVAQATLARPGKAPVTLAVLRLQTALLWGATPPAAYGGTLVVRQPDDTPGHDAAVVAPAEGENNGRSTL